jgi:Mrp family chromosome partitioning ATPase
VEPIEYLRIIRRRWPVVVVLMLLGLVIGYATARPASAATSHSAASYQATAILEIPSGTADPSGLSLDTMAFFATSGPVPDMTAKALGDRSGGRDIVSHVQVTTQDILSLLEISASEPTARRSAEVANGLSGQLITFLNDQLLATAHNDLSADRTQLNGLASIIARLQAEPTSTLVQSEITQAQSQYAQQYVSYQQLLLSGPKRTGLYVITPASASTARLVARSTSASHLRAPSGKKSRSALGGLAGLLAGLGLALVWERFDTHICTRAQAEKIFELPVLGELPRLTRSRRRRGLVVLDDPVSAASESFRMLQTALALSGRGNGRPKTILLSSPARLEGKELLVANLAASFSEAGSSVALIAADSFDPSLPRLVRGSIRGTSTRDERARFGTGPETADRGATATRTVIEGVSLLMNGVRPEIGNGQAQQHVDLVAAARRLADVVLIDVPPVLLTHDAGRFSPLVDSVVLMCELGRVTSREARLAVEALRRVGAPLQGVVLVPKQGVAAKVRRTISDTAGVHAQGRARHLVSSPGESDPSARIPTATS